VFEDRVKLTLSEQTIFVPDVMVVCDPNKIKWNGVFGTPDLVVEVLSPSTFRYDLGFKKETYGRFGVKEYWIVDVRRKSIEIYLNKDGKLELENTFILFPAAELAELKEEEIARIPTEFTVPTFPELRVSLERVFSRMIE
jgi:Uma2 family endonuclease